jgi:DNA polymerase-3 subunit beta
MNTFKFNPKALLTSLQVIAKAFATRVNVPILDYYLFEVNPGMVKVSVTDLSVTFSAFIHVGYFGPGFRAVVPKEIIKYLATLKAESSEFTWIEDSYSAEFITDGERGKFSGLEPKEFPMAPDVCEHVFDTTGVLFGQIRRLLPFMCDDERYPNKNCIGFVPVGDGVELCATDGHTLRAETLQGVSDKLGFLYAPKAAKVLSVLKIADDAVVAVYCNKERVNTRIVFDLSGVRYELISRNHHDERYPNYLAIMPDAKSTKTWLTVDKKELLSSIDKALLFANKDTNQVVFSINGSVKLNAENLDESKEVSIPLKSASSKGEEMKISFSGELLRTVANAHSEVFTLEFIAPNKCLSVHEENSHTILMPIIIK